MTTYFGVGSAELIAFMGYDSTTNPFTSDQLDVALSAAKAEIEARTNTTFVDSAVTGTALSTPAYTQVTNEKQKGRGLFYRDYFTEKYPLPDVSTTINGTALAVSGSTMYVVSTNGFPSSGIVGVESDKITYTGKSGSAFTGCSGHASAHGTAVPVQHYVIELSTTDGGTTPVYSVLAEGTEFDMGLDTGRVHVYTDCYIADPYGGSNAPMIPNRFRVSYLAGHSSIPSDMVRLVKMIASRDLMKSAVRRALGQGRNSFNPDLIETDTNEIERTLNQYRSYRITNV